MQILKNHPFGRRQVVMAILSSLGVSALNTQTADAQTTTNQILTIMERLNGTTPNTLVGQQDGSATPLASLIDRPMLINFWASWCPPCIHELPSLQVLDIALNNDGMAVLLIGIDRKPPPFGVQFLADHDITIPRSVHEISGELAREMGIKAMPTSFFVAADGGLIGKIEGPLDWQDSQIIRDVKAILSA